MSASELLFDALRAAGVRVRTRRVSALAPVREAGIAAEDWTGVAAAAHAQGWRLTAIWGEESGRYLLLNALIERAGQYLALRTRVRSTMPRIDSIAPLYPAADRMERHAHDLLGIEFLRQPDPRRWTRHQAWSEREFPLRSDFTARNGTEPTPPDMDYPFVTAHGTGVYEIPVGPVHAGIIEPGHFRFLAVGEEVLNLEQRLGYVHKGIERIAQGRDAQGLARLAARVSGDSAVAHAWAACMAMERAARISPPPRALALRGVLAEIERIVNHLWDIAAIYNDVSFTFAHYQLGRVVEDWRRVSASVFGHRLLMDTITPGGVASDVGADGVHAILAQCAATRRELGEIWAIVQVSDSLQDRLCIAGVLSVHDARAFGAVGFVGRASAQDFDVRRDAPYPPYDALAIDVPCVADGDIAARARIRHDEVLISLTLVQRLLAALPAGEIGSAFRAPRAGAEGIGIVDGWRGELVTHVRFAAQGRIARYFPRDPSWLTWPTLERLIHGNIVPDFPVCNKSVNGSYSGHDL